MKIKISKIEKQLNCKLKRNFTSIGFDTAEKCGVAFIKIDETDVTIDWTATQFDSKDKKQMYRQMFWNFNNLITENIDICVIEDTHLVFFGKFPQVDGLKKLTRFGALVMASAILKEVHFEIIGASSSRAKLGIKTTGYGRGNSKLAVADWLKDKLNIELEDNDISDAIVLALLGVIEGMDFKRITKKRKKRKKK